MTILSVTRFLLRRPGFAIPVHARLQAANSDGSP